MNESLKKLSDQYSLAVEVLPSFRDECAWKTSREKLVDLLSALRQHSEHPFEALVDVTGVDRTPLNETIEVVYHLYSHAIQSYVRVKVPLPSADPVIPTVSHIWKSANWLEREVFDLFGVKFSSHPDLRRLLMPDDYDGYPLLKEHPLCPQGDCDAD